MLQILTVFTYVRKMQCVCPYTVNSLFIYYSHNYKYAVGISEYTISNGTKIIQ